MKNFIEQYNPIWKTEFEKLKCVLNTELKDFEIDIQHIGSTSIPGLHAKPILDIDIIIKDKIMVAAISLILERLGYRNKGEQGISGRFSFRQSSDLTPSNGASGKWLEHHLYVCFSDSLALKNHILFRDALLDDTKLVKEYTQFKIELTKGIGVARDKYNKQKTEFILSVLKSNGLDEKELNEIRNVNM